MDSTLHPFRVIADISPMNLTVLRAPVVHVPAYTPVALLNSVDAQGRAASAYLDLDFAIEWDEDRDQRIFAAVRFLWRSGLLLPCVRFIGESKGCLTITVDPDFPTTQFLGFGFSAYKPAVERVANGFADSWRTEVVGLPEHKRELARLLKLRACTQDENDAADRALCVPRSGWLRGSAS